MNICTLRVYAVLILFCYL